MPFECCLYTNRRHYCTNSIKLSCDHYACVSCIKSLVYLGSFCCQHCGELHKSDEFNFDDVNDFAGTISDLYNYAHNQQTIISNEIQKCANSLDTKIEYILDEIDIRVESLKHELDILRDGIKENLTSVKDEFKR